MTQPPPGAIVPAGRSDLPALPDFMSQFSSMFDMPTADDLSQVSDPMIILSVDRDGIVKVRRKGETISTLMSNGMIVATPVAVANPNVLFWDETAKEPSCKSDDGVTGIGDIQDGNGTQTRKCAQCPAFQWGSDPKGGKGKHCKSSIIMAISCAGNALRPAAEGNGPSVAVSDKPDHRWWYEAYGLPTTPTWYGTDGDHSYVHPGPVIVRMTSSSFDVWEKALGEVKGIHASGKWPLEATVWMITWGTKDIKGHTVGVWNFRVASMTEAQKWLLQEATELKSHRSIERLCGAGHVAEGIIRHE